MSNVDVDLTCLSSSVSLFKETDFSVCALNPSPSGDGTVTVVATAPNMRTCENTLRDLALKGVPFVGSYESGVGYPGRLFVSLNGKILFTDCDPESTPVVRAYPDGSVDQGDMRRVMEFEQLREKAKDYLLKARNEEKAFRDADTDPVVPTYEDGVFRLYDPHKMRGAVVRRDGDYLAISVYTEKDPSRNE